jgi:hypothetical protein
VSSGHPTDADREKANAPAVAAALAALRAGDVGGLAGLVADHGVWLSGDARANGPAEALALAERVVATHRTWAQAQLKGSHAVLRYTDGSDPHARGALVLEVRAGRLVLVVEAP